MALHLICDSRLYSCLWTVWTYICAASQYHHFTVYNIIAHAIYNKKKKKKHSYNLIDKWLCNPLQCIDQFQFTSCMLNDHALHSKTIWQILCSFVRCSSALFVCLVWFVGLCLMGNMHIICALTQSTLHFRFGHTWSKFGSIEVDARLRQRATAIAMATTISTI